MQKAYDYDCLSNTSSAIYIFYYSVFPFQILYRMCLVWISFLFFLKIFLNHVTQYWTSWMRGEPKLMSDIFSCLFHLPSVTISIRILAAYVLNNILTKKKKSTTQHYELKFITWIAISCTTFYDNASITYMYTAINSTFFKTIFFLNLYQSYMNVSAN